MDYGEVLSKAWKIIWRFKVLWLFGILASCGSSASLNGTSSYSFSSEDQFSWQVERFFNQLSTAQWTALLLFLVVTVLGLIVLGIFLNTVGRTGVILGAQRAETGVGEMGLGGLFSGSLAYFWRVLGLALLVSVVILVAVLIFSILAVFGAVITLGLIMICLLPLLCLIIPLAFLASIYLQQSTIAIVVEDRGVFDGLRRGWQVFRQNLGVMIVMGLILGVAVSGIGGLLIASPLFLLIAPIIIAMVNNTSQAWLSAFLISGLCLLAYLPVLIVLNGMLQSYIASAWTLTFMRLTTPGSLEAVLPEPTFEPLPEPG